MKKYLILSVTILLLASLTACSVAPVSAGEVKSDKPRVTAPHVENADLATLVDGNTAFALDLPRAARRGG